MFNRLYVWEGDNFVGVFTRNPCGVIEFAYDLTAVRPISLSLPLEGGWGEGVPRNFLEGLLPDRDTELIRMKVALGAPDTDPFSLLDLNDVTGGLSFTADDEPPSQSASPIEPMTVDDIAARIRRARKEDSAWWEGVDRRCRFSLAGTQGKFSMARVGDEWFWPSASLPSTHIVKPEPVKAPGAIQIERACLALAEACGLEVPTCGVIEAMGETAYITERFDRMQTESGVCRRLRIEDFNQALGLPTRDKYLPEASEVTALLNVADPTLELSYAWFEQFAYNVHVGNADAHAKNYSLYLDHKVMLCPLYDCLTTSYWPQFTEGLAMSVNEIWYPRAITPDDWAREGETCGLDGSRVRDIAQRVSNVIVNLLPEVLEAIVEPDVSLGMSRAVVTANEGMRKKKTRG